MPVVHLKGEVKNSSRFNVATSVLRQGLAELLGAALLAFLSGGAITITGKVDAEALKCGRILAISLLDGFLYYALISLTMRLADSQGGYLNPAVTLSLGLLDSIIEWRKMGIFLLKALLFMICQFIGALGGAALILVTFPSPLSGSELTGYSHPTFGTTVLQAFFIEAILAFFFTLVVLSVRRHEVRRSSLLIGFTYVAIRLLSYPLSGGFVNPARSLGPAVVSTTAGLPYVWIYMSAPFAGSALAVFAFITLHKEIASGSELQDSGDGM